MVSSADGAATLSGASAGPVLGHRPAPVRAAAHAVRRHPGRRGDRAHRAVQARPAAPGALGMTCGKGRTLTPPIAVVTRRLDLDPDSPLITAAPAGRPHHRHHHRSGPAGRPGRPRAARRRDRGRPGERRLQGGRGRPGRTRPPPSARRGRPAPARRAARGRPARRALPDHRPAAGGPGPRPDRGRRTRPPRPCRWTWRTSWTRTASCSAATSGKIKIIRPNEAGARPRSPARQGRGSRPRSKPTATAAARSLTPSLA